MTVQPRDLDDAAGLASRSVQAGDPIRMLTAQHEVTLFPEPAPLFDELARLIGESQRSVFLETYIYRSDRMGGEFAEHLRAAAGRGVDVRLIYDPLGSRGEDPRFFESLVASGIKVRAYRPWKLAPWRWTYWPRDHGRMVVVDDFACTGGINWGEEWWPTQRGGEGWHDVSVGARGPVVADFVRAFVRRWHEAHQLDQVADWATGDPGADVELLADSPASTALILDRFCDEIDRARWRVWLENSYCVPPYTLLSALRRAAARGVDVRLVLPAKTDIPVVRAIARGEYAEWLALGIHIHEYQPTVMHSKFALVDDDWATVGTFNAMTPGIWWANETNLIVRDARFVEELAKGFQSDLEKSVPVTLDWFRNRSYAERSAARLAAHSYRGVEYMSLALRPFIQRAFHAGR